MLSKVKSDREKNLYFQNATDDYDSPSQWRFFSVTVIA